LAAAATATAQDMPKYILIYRNKETTTNQSTNQPNSSFHENADIYSRI